MRPSTGSAPAHAILASNTSYLDIFKFVETRRPDKVIITHWFAPPHIVPLVEIVRGPQTSSETVETVKALMIRVGKKPIVISKFLPGFIANRLQSALNREVLFLLDNGYARRRGYRQGHQGQLRFADADRRVGETVRFHGPGFDPEGSPQPSVYASAGASTVRRAWTGWWPRESSG